MGLSIPFVVSHWVFAQHFSLIQTKKKQIKLHLNCIYHSIVCECVVVLSVWPLFCDDSDLFLCDCLLCECFCLLLVSISIDNNRCIFLGTENYCFKHFHNLLFITLIIELIGRANIIETFNSISLLINCSETNIAQYLKQDFVFFFARDSDYKQENDGERTCKESISFE